VVFRMDGINVFSNRAQEVLIVYPLHAIRAPGRVTICSAHCLHIPGWRRFVKTRLAIAADPYL
jgi:hypothetical protein